MFWIEVVGDYLEDNATFLPIEKYTDDYTTTKGDIWLFELSIIK